MWNPVNVDGDSIISHQHGAINGKMCIAISSTINSNAFFLAPSLAYRLFGLLFVDRWQ